MKLAIFPLPIVVFPGGVTRLRIFEPRYVRMIKEASPSQGFGLTTFTPNSPYNVEDWAVQMKIIDFEAADDGFFMVDVKGEKLVTLDALTVDEDQLLQAEVSPRAHWPEHPFTDDIRALASGLLDIYEQNPTLGHLYPQPQIDSATWVCARWLEIMPIPATDKALFIQPDSFDKAVELLTSIFEREQ